MNGLETVLLTAAIVGGIGLVCSVILVLAARFMSVKKDETEEKLRGCLPGANCGACGYTGCDGYAAALASGEETRTNLCVPGADAVSKQISDLLGVAFEDVIEKVAFVRCGGDCHTAKQKHEYAGIGSCAAANLLWNGEKECTCGCLGYGDCARICPNGAICIENGVAHVDSRKCSGCGMCARVCPNHIIQIISDVDHVVLTCRNTEKGAIARKKCSNACIACRKCEKSCEHDAVHIVNNVAEIDYEKCVTCGNCAEACPVGCIKISDFSGVHRFKKE